MNSAGNSANSNWYGGYSPGVTFLEFSPGVETNSVFLSAGVRFVAQLRWDDTWGNVARDLDLFLSDGAMMVVDSSLGSQLGQAGHDPYEYVDYTPLSSGTYHLVIDHVGGAAPSWLQLDAFFGQSLGTGVASRSIVNPADSASPGMLAVGAAHWSTPSTIESFSSLGPTTDDRTKPDIVGADGGASVSYPSGFFGTSQASPHLAGLAALVLERFPGFAPDQVADFLKTNALPRGAVPNDTWGYGFAQLPLLEPGPPTAVSAVAGDG